jgi:membrane associated rhomboid family serine protease
MPRKAPPPWTVLAIIAACLAGALASALDPSILDQFGFIAAQPSIRTALTSLLLHAGPLHLLGNMIFLAAVGPLIELSEGRLRLMTIFLLSGLAGVGAHAAWAAESVRTLPLVGASGGVAGGVGYVLIRHIHVRVPLWKGIGAPAGIIAAVWAALQVFAGFVELSGAGAGQVSVWSHLGGLVLGLAFGLALGSRRSALQSYGHQVLDEMNQRGPGAVLHAAETALIRRPDDLEALAAKARALEDLHDPEAATAWLKLLDRASGSARREALFAIDRLHAWNVLPIERRMRLAHELQAAHPELAEAIWQSVAADPDAGGERGHALLALAGILRLRDPEGAGALLRQLQGESPLHPAAETARHRGWIE